MAETTVPEADGTVPSTAPGIDAAREVIAGSCPECGEEALARYQVLSEGGWFLVEKCRACLHSLRRKPWHTLGYVTREGIG
jgi:predicted RNA-binding Zn-ribbon protein involved in translation (DUF1610 family)